MSNKAAVVIVGALLVISIMDRFLYFSHPIFDHSHTLAQAVALIMMLANGTFTDKKYHNLTYLLIGGAIFGGALKILHWTGADQILITAVCGLLILYSIHFVTKDSKRYLDILKLITVFSSAAAIILTATRWVYDPWVLNQVATAIFWITFVWFIVEGVRKKQFFTKENP